jgi:NAD-dependent deacetylase
MTPNSKDQTAGNALEAAAQALREATRVAVLTGAGVSAESGVPTFRGAGGLWEGHRVEEVASPVAFRRNPELVWRFYNERRKRVRAVLPNPGHHALVELEKRKGEGFVLVTQNVDGLHRTAGSQRLLELHGNLARVRCTVCEAGFDNGQVELPDLPQCGECGSLLRPDIVWFGEMLSPDLLDKAETAARACECFLIVGTSAVVHPAAGLALLAKDNGARLIEINPDVTPASDWADLSLRGPSGQVLPSLIALL